MAELSDCLRIFRNFLDAETKKAGHEGVFKWDEWSFTVNQVCLQYDYIIIS